MGKLTALIIVVFTAVWLAPMCARLPDDLSRLSIPTGAPAPVAAVPTSTPAPAPVETPAPAPVPKSDIKPVNDKGVIVIAYRLKKMFTITDGRGRVSVLLRNESDQKAVELKLTMNATKAGEVVEHDNTNIPFELESGSGTYRGLFASAERLDALLASPPEAGAELRWALTYRLEGDDAQTKRCFALSAVPRTSETEGIAWTPGASSSSCPK